MAMADRYGLFWNSDSGDRKYDAQSFEKWLKKFFTSGVFQGDLQVLASSGMTVQVQTGYSNVNGKVGLFESATNVTLSAANSRYPRIDTIIIERNDADRVIQIDKVTGAYTGENPQPTAPIWDEAQGIYQLVLAQIYVGAGVSSISQEDITDKRTDTDVCGYIAGTVNEMDFSQFTAQFKSYFSTFEATQLAEFEEWFDHMKDQLDSDAAGHLQAEVDEINGIIAPVQLTLTASQPYAIGEQFIYDGKLYTAISAIAEYDTIVIGTNASLSAEIVKQIKSAKDAIGNLPNLTTDTKTSAVEAINEVDAHADTAQSKADIVQSQLNAAIQSIAQNTTDIATNAAGISALNTGLATKMEFIGAINTKYSSLSELYTAGQTDNLKIGTFRWNAALRPTDTNGYVFIGNWCVTAIRDDFNVIFRLNSNSTWEKIVDIATDNDFLKYHGTTTDLNWALKNGIWVYNPSSANYPSGNDYGVCLVLNNGNYSYNANTWFFQLAFGTNGHIYTRSSINATDARGWTRWATIK